MSRVALTYKDYMALPDDGRRYQILDGELCVTPAPGRKHQEISGNFYAILREHIMRQQLGWLYYAPVDVILSDTTIVQPDLVFVASDRESALTSRGIEGAPTLVVEILSPSTRETDRNVKLRLYASYGVPWYWIVDPDARAVEVYKLAAGSYVLSERVAGDEALSAEPFSDLTIPAAALWA
jgi:Uma2 family endonuclease